MILAMVVGMQEAAGIVFGGTVATGDSLRISVRHDSQSMVTVDS